MGEQEYTTLTGTVEEVAFVNEDTGFTVLELDAGGELINVVGQLMGAEVGEELRLTGYFQTHASYGLHFKAQLFERSLAATDGAIQKYLSSGVVKGIGPKIAKRIVQQFHEDTLRVIEEEPERLIQVDGINATKAEKLSQEFRQAFGVRALMLFLQANNINPMQSVRVFKRWGPSALDRIRENPYLLSTGDFGIPFETADRIARAADFPLEHPERIYAALFYVLSFNLSNGYTCIPRYKLLPMAGRLLGLETEPVSDYLDEALKEGRLRSYEASRELIYLPVYYEAQRYIVGRLQVMLQVYSTKVEGVEETIRLIEEEKGIRYEELQRRAIREAAENDVFILTGGPGTGKTTALNGIIEVLEQAGRRVALAAPTGRAAKRMAEVTGREAKTIHRLLEVAAEAASAGRLEFLRNEQNPLEADAIIVDEMSMVDTLLFDALLRGMKPTAKLVLVGDFHQLPSVGAGNVLRDLIQSDTIPTVELTRIFRQAAQSLIVTNAHAIVSGQMPDLTRKDNDFFFLGDNQPAHAAQTILDLCSRRLPASYGFSPLEDIQVLCPSRKGELGTVELNARLQSRLNPPAPDKTEFKSGIFLFRVGDKVMQIRNNYDLQWTRGEEKGSGVFNGDIGIIRMIDRGSRTMGVDFDGRMAYYAFDLSSELELAYAVTVHKSQGSEFEAIILPVMGGFDKLYYRNLLYTAVTRAKRILILIGQKSRVEFMVRNEQKTMRYTGMKAMLQDSVLR